MGGATPSWTLKFLPGDLASGQQREAAAPALPLPLPYSPRLACLGRSSTRWMDSGHPHLEAAVR